MSGDKGRPPSDDRRESASDTEGWTSDGEESTPDRTTDPERESAGVGRTGSGGYQVSEDGLGERIASVANADSEWVAFAREVLTSVAAVVAVGLLLFAISGVWPPMVAIESDSMVPHMQKGDLVFVMEEGRLAPESAHGETGVVTAAIGEDVGYTKFKQSGDVIVYQPYGDERRTPIIHRAMLWVDEGENWYDRANPEYVDGADNCRQLSNCPAERAGFITKGDNNPGYDQALGISSIVRPNWVIGTAEIRIPYLGWIRLSLSTLSSESGPLVASVSFESPESPVATGPSSIGPLTTESTPSIGSPAVTPVPVGS